MLGPEYVGRRVAVRIRLDDPEPGRRFTDITGELIEIGTEQLARTARFGGGRHHRRGRRGRGPGDPAEADAVLRDHRARTAARGHLARDRDRRARRLGPAVPRRGSRCRANSVLAPTAPPGGIDAAMAAVEAWYDARGARPRVALAGPVTKRLDQELAARGWEAEGATAVMTKGVEPVAYEGEARVVDAPCEALLEQVGHGTPELAAQIFGSGPDRGYAEVWRDGELAARGRGAVAGDPWRSPTSGRCRGSAGRGWARRCCTRSRRGGPSRARRGPRCRSRPTTRERLRCTDRWATPSGTGTPTGDARTPGNPGKGRTAFGKR